jgi:acyl dehydratase
MIDYDTIKSWSFDEVRYEYGDRETMLYALAIGMGEDPLHRGELRFTYEGELQSVPTMATLVGAPGAWWGDPRTGADVTGLVQGEQRTRWWKPLPPKGMLLARNRVVSLTDKGAGRGAIGVVRRDILDAVSGELIAQSVNVSFLRRDGGFSLSGGKSDPLPEPLPGVPNREPDVSVSLSTLPQAALLYRLTGDRNPLHADPSTAARAGFQRPILHGLCTYGMACHALLRSSLDYDTTRLRELSVRFTAPVYPGEAVCFGIWRGAGAGVLHLRGRVPAREAVVLDNGVAKID